jgi:D-alanine-D-alanine ligase-like ATP-grasp enzyme
MKKARCIYCGNNQTNHAFAWFDQTLSIFFEGVNRRMGRMYLVRKTAKLLDLLTRPLLWFFEKIRVVSWNTDLAHVPGNRGKVLWEEAAARGIPMRSLRVFKRYLDVYEATVAGVRIYFFSLPTIDGQDSKAIWWMDDKGLLKKKLTKAGIPTARGGTFWRLGKARRVFEKLDKPVITKPRLGSRGRHTTTAIHTKEDLTQGFRVAKKLCHFVIMEEHLVGSVYRGTIVDGKLVGVLRGDPPRVTGDGVSSIEQLIAQKNATRDARIAEVVPARQHIEYLARIGYTLESVVPEGVTIDLIEKIGISYGGNSKEVTPDTHPKIVSYLEQAARVVDYPLIGFDFIIEDPSRDPDTQKWGIIEANSAPFINLHHDPIEGVPINAAAKVWDMVERKLQAKKSIH